MMTFSDTLKAPILPYREEREVDVPPVIISYPVQQTVPLVVASPHSGSFYEADFLASSRLDAKTLRRSEDFYVHDLLAGAPSLGAPLIRATFPRAFIDANREPYEIDPAMFDGPVPSYANTRSPRVQAGLGTIAKIVASGADIYHERLPVTEIERRVEHYYAPYHAALKKLVEQTCEKFGWCLLLDGHSMPSIVPPLHRATAVDFVLGDWHGRSCDRAVTDRVHDLLNDLGFIVVRNSPYAGGFTTRHYGAPMEGVHALQIEMSRGLYMDEASYARLPSFTSLSAALSTVMAAVAQLPQPR